MLAVLRSYVSQQFAKLKSVSSYLLTADVGMLVGFTVGGSVGAGVGSFEGSGDGGITGACVGIFEGPVGNG